MRLDGKIAAVTGCSRGIGQGIAVRLAGEGASLLLNDVTEEALAETAEQVRVLGRDFVLVPGDVADPQFAERLIGTATERFGHLDVMVNNAGINRDAILHRMTDQQWHDVLAVDLTAVFYLTRAAAQHMRARGYGRIVNISSGSWLGNVGQANYAAAKAGVVGLTKTAARELAPKGVTANAICPGFIDTAMTRAVPEPIREKVLERIPMGRPGRPRDVANLVAFLASDDAEYITGEVINVAGGYIT